MDFSPFYPPSLQPYFVGALLLSIPFFTNYVIMWIMYHMVHRSKERQVPPVLPSILPSLENTLGFLFNSAGFVRRATRYAGRATGVCVTLGFQDVYLIQDSPAVAAVWKQSQLASPLFIYAYGLRNLFGMPKSCLMAYESDTSGPYKRPFPDSNVAAHNRIDFLTHQSLARAFTGPGLKPIFERIKKTITENLDAPFAGEMANSWNTNSDMMKWSKDVIGRAIIQAIFGKRLLDLNPSFMEDLWIFDDNVPSFARQIPRFMMPKAFKARVRLLEGIRRWYNVARQEFDDGKIYPDGDGDPVWGSYLMRERQQILGSVEGHDDEGLAAADLGLIWASVTNVVASAMMMQLHIWSDKTLLSRVRLELSNKTWLRDCHAWSTNSRSLDKLPLLNSIYAETLRCYVQAFITRGNAPTDLAIGSWWLPRTEIAMISSEVNHMDEALWNTQGGMYPVKKFWSDRFLVKSNDGLYGPMRAELRAAAGLDTQKRRGQTESVLENLENDDVFCDMRGLEGNWIPYGGGYGACPGRILSKQLMLWFCAHMITHYDVEIMTKSWKMDSWRYGFGMQKPVSEIPFRMRRLRP